MRFARVALWLVASFAAWLPTTTGISGQQADATLEIDVKATFLYHFSRYIEWPRTAFANENTPFRVCVVADEAFRISVSRILQGEVVSGRPIRLLSPEGAEEVRTCHMLFIGRSDVARAPGLLAAIRGNPILAVSDMPDFLEQGGHLEFVRDRNRVRFDVNLTAIKQQALTVSSKLLRVARRVIGNGRTAP